MFGILCKAPFVFFKSFCQFLGADSSSCLFDGFCNLLILSSFPLTVMSFLTLMNLCFSGSQSCCLLIPWLSSVVCSAAVATYALHKMTHVVIWYVFFLPCFGDAVKFLFMILQQLKSFKQFLCFVASEA